jgi:hypothetical protein
MKEPRKRDPVGRMDQIVEELSALYTEADLILDSYVDRISARPLPAFPGTMENSYG